MTAAGQPAARRSIPTASASPTTDEQHRPATAAEPPAEARLLVVPVGGAYAAVRVGVRALDASAGGIGGCPFAPAATGNVATEDLVWMLERMGVATCVDAGAMAQAGA